MDLDQDVEATESLVDDSLRQEPLLQDSPSSNDVSKKVTLVSEGKELLFLAMGMFLARASWVIMKTTDTALLGHVSSHALSASAIADLWTSSTGVICMGGVLGIFVGQALGAGNTKLAIVWLQISLVVVISLSGIVMLLWCLTGPVLKLFHTDKDLIDDAAYFAGSMSAAIPARTIMMQVSQFMSANKVVKPEAKISTFACLFNLIVGLIVVLGIPIKGFDGWGFKACPWVTVSTEYVQLVVLWLVYGYGQGLHVKLGWQGWDLTEVTRERVKEYLKIYVPSALSLCSDFFRVSVIGVFATHLGSDEVAVFNSSYRILWISLTLIGSLGFAVRVRLSSFIGAGDIENAKLCITVGLLIAGGLLFVLSTVVLVSVGDIAVIFSDDQHIIDLFSDSRVPLALTLILMNLTVLLEQIPYAMGKARAVFLVGVVGSWLGQVPGVYLVITFWKDTIVGLYYGVAAGYALVAILLLWIVAHTNWEEVVEDARVRSEVQ